MSVFRQFKHKKNGKEEIVDLGALAQNITEDSTHRFVSDTEKQNWNNKMDAVGDIANAKVSFGQAASRANINSGETVATISGKLKKWYADFKAVVWSGSYTDLLNKPTLGAAASQGLANNLTTTASGYAMDARQGPAIQQQFNQINSDLNVRYNSETDYIQIYVDGGWHDSIVAGFKTSVALVPNMTAPTLPYGKASASSEYSGRPAYQAFNGKIPNPTDGTTFWLASSYNAGEWLEYQFSEAVSITSFKFSTLKNINFKLQYFGNSAWVDAYVGRAESDGVYFTAKECALDGRVVTSRVRIYITAAGADIALGAVQFYGSKLI